MEIKHVAICGMGALGICRLFRHIKNIKVKRLPYIRSEYGVWISI